MTYKYYLGLGSNIEPRIDNFNKACEHLLRFGQILNKSALYKSQAWGNKKQSEFYNAIIIFTSLRTPQKLLKEIKNIENFIGRKKREKWGPREIDIDILLCENCQVNEPDLKIPHPLLTERLFVLVPLAELDKDLRIPNHKKAITELLDTCTDQSYIQKIESVW